MNATMVASGTKAVPPMVSSIQDIPLAKIRESKTNPRRLLHSRRCRAQASTGVTVRAEAYPEALGHRFVFVCRRCTLRCDLSKVCLALPHAQNRPATGPR